MTTLNEFAALASYVYNNERGARTPINRLDLPASWVELGPVNNFPAQSAYDDNFFSFTAGAYLNSSTGEIVIAYNAKNGVKSCNDTFTSIKR